MASNKEFKTRIQHKIDTPENWAKATNFVPLAGEIIVYDYFTSEGFQNKIKIGDGSNYLADLPFINTNTFDSLLTYDDTQGTLSNIEAGSIGPDELELFGLIYGITTFYIEFENDSLQSMKGLYQLCNVGDVIYLISSNSFLSNKTSAFFYDETNLRWNHNVDQNVYLPQSPMGSSTKGIIVKSDGTISTTSTYAGGTKITLNGTSEGGSSVSLYAPTTFGTDGQILQAKGEKVAPIWVDPSDLLSGDFLPVDELTDSYAKVRPLLLSADNGEVSLTPSGINVENSDGDIIAINSTGVSATNTESEDYAILNTQGVSAYSSTGEIYTSLDGASGLSLQGGEKVINLNYNGLNIDTDDLSLGLESTNGLTFSNYLTGKSIVLSPEKLILDRGSSNTTIDEQKFQLTRDSGEQTTLTSTSLQLKIPKPLEDGETTRTYSTFTINGDASNSTYTINTSNFLIRSEQTIGLQAEKIFLNSPTEIDIEPEFDNSIVNKKYVDEKVGKPSENVIIYQDDGTNSGNYNPAIGTLIVSNEIEADLLEDGSLVYDVVFTQDEEGIPASAIDFTPNSYINENNVQSAIENLQTKVATSQNTLSDVSTTINTHTTNINALDSTVASHTTSINTINTTVNSHTSTINSHTTSINNLQTAMNNLVTDVWHIGSTPPSNAKLFWIDTNTTTGGLKYLPSGSTNSAANWKHVPVAWT